jgi:hypothetical protein
VYTNKSGIAEAAVGDGEDFAGAGTDDDRLIAVDVVGAELALDLDPSDEPPHAPRSGPTNRTIPMPPMRDIWRDAFDCRDLAPALGSRAADDDFSGARLALETKLSPLVRRGRVGRKIPVRFIPGSLPAGSTAGWPIATP